MMTGRQRYILASRSLCRIHKLFCPIGGGIEFFVELIVFFVGNHAVVASPFAATKHTVNAEMNKHAKAMLFKRLDIILNNHKFSFEYAVFCVIHATMII